MNRFSGIFSILCFALLIIGCAGTNFIRITDNRLVLGETTSDQIKASLGAPYKESVIFRNNQRLNKISYAYANATVNSGSNSIIPARSQGFYFYNNKLVGYDFTSSWEEDNTNFDDTQISQIIKDKSTYKDAIDIFGKPGGKYLYPLIPAKNGYAVIYLYCQSNKGIGINVKSTTKLLLISFNPENIVTNVEYTNSDQNKNNRTMEKPICDQNASTDTLPQLIDDKRSLKTIKNSLLKNRNNLDSFINSNKAILNFTDSTNIGLSISSNGHYSLFWIINNIKLDSASGISFIHILNRAELDSIPNRYSTKVMLSLKRKNTISTYSIKDTIWYCPMRSKSSIMSIVMLNLKYLRYAYNKRLQERPGIKGKITVKFAIDEFGKTIYSSIVGSTIDDKVLEKNVRDYVKSWEFCPINNNGDITEVVYPFVFSQ